METRISPDRLHKIAISALLVMLMLVGGLRVLDQAAIDQLDQSFKRALATYAVVRGINAVISVVQGTEVAIEPGGVGVILAPGEIFDPINDLAERFSWVMLLSSASIGAQRLLVSLSEAWLMQALMLAGAAFTVWHLWTPRRSADRYWRDGVSRVAIFLLVLRFAIPVTAVAGDLIYQHFLANRYQAAYTALDATHQEVKALRKADQETRDDGTLIGRIDAWLEEKSRQLSIEDRIAEYRDRLGDAVSHIMELIIIFLLQTVLLPLLFLSVGLHLVRVINPLPALVGK